MKQCVTLSVTLAKIDLYMKEIKWSLAELFARQIVSMIECISLSVSVMLKQFTAFVLNPFDFLKIYLT